MEQTMCETLNEVCSQWIAISESACLCHFCDRQQIQLKTNTRLFMANYEKIVYKETQSEIVGCNERQMSVVVDTLHTLYDGIFFCSASSFVTCKSLFNFLIESHWITELCNWLLRRVSCSESSQFFQYVCSKLLAHILLTVRELERGIFFLRLSELILNSEYLTRLSALTTFEKMFRHSHNSVHPTDNCVVSDLKNFCSNVMAPQPSTCLESQSALLKVVDWTKVLKTVVCNLVWINDERKVKLAEMEKVGVIVSASFRVWDSGCECWMRLKEGPFLLMDDDSALWCWRLMMNIWRKQFSRAHLLVNWPSGSMLQFFCLVKIYLQRFSKKHFSTLELAAAIVEAYTDGILDDIPLNAPARSFGGVICKQTVCLNPAFRLLALVLLKAVDVVFENVENSVNRGKVALNKFVESIQSLGSAWLWCLFSDQDDYLSEALACTLNVYSQLPNRDPLGLLLEPNKTFYAILTNLSFDHTIILDWITSDETCFLEYFVKFLKFFISNKNDKLHCTLLHLVDYSSSSGSDEEDQLAHVEIPSIAIASFCKTLYISINKLYKRNLFPFNAQPLLKLLEEAQ